MRQKQMKVGMKNISLLISVVALTLSGCSTLTEAQKEGMRLQSAVSDVFRNTQACSDRIQSKPRYALIYEKFGVGREPPTIRHLADSAMVSDELIPLGFDWYAEAQECNRGAIEGFARIDPELGAIAADWDREVTRIMLNAVTTRPTYGQINSDVANYIERRKRDIARTRASVTQRLNSQHNAELRQRDVDDVSLKSLGEVFALAVLGLASQQNAMAQAQRSYVASYPAYVPVQTITQTQCTRYGPTVYCSSR